MTGHCHMHQADTLKQGANSVDDYCPLSLINPVQPPAQRV